MSTSSSRVALGLGANIGDCRATFGRACEALESISGTRILRRARLYGSKPMGPQTQPDYLNTAILIETTVRPVALFFAIKAIELQLGRTPTYHWGPRVIDIDMLTYDQTIIALPELQVPHPQLHHRAFVLKPLCDLEPTLHIPKLSRNVAALLAELGDTGDVWPIDETKGAHS